MPKQLKASPNGGAFFFAKKWKDKPIGGGHGLENRSELTTRVGSTPTSSAVKRT